MIRKIEEMIYFESYGALVVGSRLVVGASDRMAGLEPMEC